jgi:hypothetical protein
VSHILIDIFTALCVTSPKPITLLAMPPKKQGSRGKLPSGRRPPPGNRPSTSGSKVSLKCRIESSDDEHNTSVDFFDFLPSGIVDSSQPSTQIGPLTETVVCHRLFDLKIISDHMSSPIHAGCEHCPHSHQPHLHP